MEVLQAVHGTGRWPGIGQFASNCSTGLLNSWETFYYRGPSIQITVPASYCCCMAVAAGSSVMLWRAKKLDEARRRSQLRPVHITNKSQPPQAYGFLFYIHSSIISSYPQFIWLLMLGGLECPIAASWGGALWLVSKLSFHRQMRPVFLPENQTLAHKTLCNVGTLILAGSALKFFCRLLNQ